MRRSLNNRHVDKLLCLSRQKDVVEYQQLSWLVQMQMHKLATEHPFGFFTSMPPATQNHIWTPHHYEHTTHGSHVRPKGRADPRRTLASRARLTHRRFPLRFPLRDTGIWCSLHVRLNPAPRSGADQHVWSPHHYEHDTHGPHVRPEGRADPRRRRKLRRCLASRAPALRFVIRLTNLRFPLRDTGGCACCPHMRPMCIESSWGSPNMFGRPTTTSTPPMDPTCALRVARTLGEPLPRAPA